MNWQRLGIFIAINIIVSAIVTLLILSLWESRRPAVAPAPTAEVPSTRPSQAASPATDTSSIETAEPTAAVVAPTPTVPGAPFVYVIESGDTLGSLSLKFDVPLADLLAVNNLTEDSILSVGQEITIPVGDATPVAPSLTATPAASPGATSSPAFMTIREIESPGVLGQETVILTNLGEVINLAQWTLSDGAGNRYTFPDVTVFANGEIKLHTRAGTNTPSDLYWGESEARWAKAGTVAYLRDTGGKLVATYRVP
jgi:LysM repeat protein